MPLLRQSNGQILSLDLNSTLGQGGEARVYSLPQNKSLAAKVYHQPTDAHVHKLVAMIANPPENPTAKQWHISIAWPIDMLRTVDNSQRVVGFLMPHVKGMFSIIDFYNPKTRNQICPSFNYRYLHRTAQNLAAAVQALHLRGYCIGDVNESNILVSNTALVTLVDTDSFQLRDPENGVVYRCCVGKPEFTPPELQGQSFASVDRAIEHDLFGLAVLIFQLLMEGTHPFSGIFQGLGDPPPYCARIADGHFPYSTARRGPYIPTLIAPPFEILPSSLRELFVRCFEDGYDNPKMRPSAETWQNAINEAEKDLVICSANNQHRYGRHLSACPWCERTRLLGGRDPFPSLEAVQQGQHLQPIQRKRVSQLGGHITPTLPQSIYLQRSVLAARSSANKRLSPVALGLLGVSFAGLLAGLVMARTLNLALHSSASRFPTTSDTASPQPITDSTQGYLEYKTTSKIYYKLRGYQREIENYSKALVINPKDAKAYVKRGSAQYQIAQHSGKPDQYYRKALKDLNTALLLLPANAEAYLKRGFVRYQLALYSSNPTQDYKEAIEDLNQALRINPNEAEAYLNRGIVRSKLGQYSGDLNKVYKAAIKDFDQALRINPNEAEAYLNRGIVRSKLGQYGGNFHPVYKGAVADLHQAAKLFLKQGDIARHQQALELCQRERLDGL